MRALLEAFRDGEAPPEAPEPTGDGFEPALDRMTRLFGLTPFERQLLVLSASVELDGEIAALAAALQLTDDPHPTFGLALAALPDAHWDALAPLSPLRRRRLVELGAGPTLASRPLAARRAHPPLPHGHPRLGRSSRRRAARAGRRPARTVAAAPRGGARAHRRGGWFARPRPARRGGRRRAARRRAGARRSARRDGARRPRRCASSARAGARRACAPARPRGAAARRRPRARSRGRAHAERHGLGRRAGGSVGRGRRRRGGAHTGPRDAAQVRPAPRARGGARAVAGRARRCARRRRSKKSHSISG